MGFQKFCTFTKVCLFHRGREKCDVCRVSVGLFTGFFYVLLMLCDSLRGCYLDRFQNTEIHVSV